MLRKKSQERSMKKKCESRVGTNVSDKRLQLLIKFWYGSLIGIKKEEIGLEDDKLEDYSQRKGL